MKVFFKPNNLLILVGLILFAISFFVSPTYLNFNALDTYIGIYNIQLLRILVIAFILFSILYKLLKSVLTISVLSWIHIGLMLIAVAIFFFSPNQGPKHLYTNTTFGKIPTLVKSTTTVHLTILMFMISQLVFLVHLVYGAVKKIAGRKVRLK